MELYDFEYDERYRELGEKYGNWLGANPVSWFDDQNFCDICRKINHINLRAFHGFDEPDHIAACVGCYIHEKIPEGYHACGCGG